MASSNRMLGAIEDVDSPRRQADLENSVVRDELVRADLEGREWRTECRQRAIHALCVLPVGANQYVEVSGCPRMSVEGDSVPSEHHELGFRVCELDEQIPEVVRELDHGGSKARSGWGSPSGGTKGGRYRPRTSSHA
ncbi:MAG: hypothetical protein ACXVCJ_04785 [Polyangiales bacterium]